MSVLGVVAAGGAKRRRSAPGENAGGKTVIKME
jgi:hypothetical protein